jgi:dTDP-4-amino-4,6-dideoxygalactose transaminase
MQDQVLSLPMGPHLSDAQVLAVAAAVRAALA